MNGWMHITLTFSIYLNAVTTHDSRIVMGGDSLWCDNTLLSHIPFTLPEEQIPHLFFQIFAQTRHNCLLFDFLLTITSLCLSQVLCTRRCVGLAESWYWWILAVGAARLCGSLPATYRACSQRLLSPTRLWSQVSSIHKHRDLYCLHI